MSAKMSPGGWIISIGVGVGVPVTLGAVTWYALHAAAPEIRIPLFIVASVVAFIAILGGAAMVFSGFGLADPSQALGLPDGTIRAVLSLAIVVIFAVLSVFLYEGVSQGGAPLKLDYVSDSDRALFLKQNPNIRNLQITSVSLKPNDPATNPDKTPNLRYDITYQATSPSGDDFAKQLLVLLGTLMASVTSFYLGARTAASAASAGVTQGANAAQSIPGSPGGPPNLDPHAPIALTTAATPVAIFQLTGSNLDGVVHAKIVRDSVEVPATANATATKVTITVPISSTTTPPGGAWTVVVEDGLGRSASLAGVLNIA